MEIQNKVWLLVSDS